MKYQKKWILFWIILNSMLLTSCYEVNTDQKTDYTEFRNEMQKKNDFIYQVLPILNDESVVEDVYLYYSDRDLLDSFYTVYLNCIFSEEKYTLEYERLQSLSGEEGNILSFEYESIVFYYYMEFGSVDMVDFSYVLFDEDENRIVYVLIFEKGEEINIETIPKAYLPKEYLLRFSL